MIELEYGLAARSLLPSVLHDVHSTQLPVAPDLSS